VKVVRAVRTVWLGGGWSGYYVFVMSIWDLRLVWLFCGEKICK